MKIFFTVPIRSAHHHQVVRGAGGGHQPGVALADAAGQAGPAGPPDGGQHHGRGGSQLPQDAPPARHGFVRKYFCILFSNYLAFCIWL